MRIKLCFLGIGALMTVCLGPMTAHAEPNPPAPAPSAPSAPLAPADAVRQALARGEAAYRSGQTERALAEFQALLVLDPRHPRAQLRLGNLHHQAGRDAQAIQAYTLAAEAAGSDPGEARVRAKAHLNLALLHRELAERAWRDLDPEEGMAVQAARRQLAQDLKGAPAQADASGGPNKTAAAAGKAAAAPEARPAAAPYTVDRWVGHARRRAGAAPPARGIVAEPVTESPLPPAPRIETVRGAGGGR